MNAISFLKISRGPSSGSKQTANGRGSEQDRSEDSDSATPDPDSDSLPKRSTGAQHRDTPGKRQGPSFNKNTWKR